MLKSLGDFYAMLFGWPVLARLNRAIFYLAARGLGLHNYSNDNISGEKFLLKKILAAARREPVVFDVGANEGRWSRSVLAFNPSARVHAFEPQAALAAHIAAEFPSITVNPVAVGEREESLTLFDYAEGPGSEHATLLPRVIEQIHAGKAVGKEVPVITLDEYCRKQSIEQIDLLKIDVEGLEFAVLKGTKNMIDAGRIACIQFEFNEMNVVSRVFLQDIVGALGSAYAFYRVLPHGLMKMKHYSPWWWEQFVFQNLVAIRIDALSAGTDLNQSRRNNT